MANARLPLLPLILDRVPPGLRQALAQEGIPIRDRLLGPPQARFLLFDSRTGRQDPPAAGQVALDVAPLRKLLPEDPFEALVDERMGRFQWRVAGLTLTSPSDGGWDLAFNKHAGGFGTFDFRLEGGVGIDPDQIFPGSTETFVFNILGTAPFFDTDFTSDLSTIPPGDMPSFGAAKFVEGPGDDSAYGATAPEPATLVLLALGSLTLLRTRRR